MVRLDFGGPYWQGERLLLAKGPSGRHSTDYLSKMVNYELQNDELRIMKDKIPRDVRWAADYLKWTYI